jgi:hypothetical protein
LLRQHADIRPACELHTHRLWDAHADTYGGRDGYTYSNCYCDRAFANTDGNSHCDGAFANTDSNGECDRTTAAYTDATSAADTAASTVIR